MRRWLLNRRCGIQVSWREGCVSRVGGKICVSPIAQKNQQGASNEGAYFPIAFSDGRALSCVEFVVCQPHCNALIHFLVVYHIIWQLFYL